MPTVPTRVYLGNNHGCTQGEVVRLCEEEEKDVSSSQRHLQVIKDRQKMDDLSGAFPLNLIDKRSLDAQSVFCGWMVMVCSAFPGFCCVLGTDLGLGERTGNGSWAFVAKEEKQDFGARQTFTSKFQFLHFSSCVIFNKLFDFS